MFRSFRYAFAALLVSAALTGGAVASTLPTIMEDKDVLPYLEKMISWQRQGTALEISPELPREQIIKSAYQQHAQKALNDSFSFAQSIADILPPRPAPAVTEEKMENASKKVGIRHAVRTAEAHIEQLQKSLSHARLRAERERLSGELKLEQEHLTLLKAVAETIGAPGEEDDNSLSREITALYATIAPQEGETKKAEDPAAAQASAAATPASGILGIATRAYSFIQAKSAIKSLLNDTKAQLDANKNRTQAIRDAVKGLLDAGKSAQAAAPVPKPSLVGPVREVPTYDSLVADMRKLSKVATAISATNKSLEICVNDLTSWMSLISGHVKELLSDLVFRCVMLTVAIAVTLILASLARKATRRYVADRRRRDQLRIVRRAVLILTISIILFLGFFTDLNSLATFAGLLTAGIAFAMKDMILSLIAYFQFFGSSDIRVGDDVSIGGVNGKITHIGMLRFYMVETQKSDVGFLPTGRLVGFANSVLFQPTPFFRQSSGINFVWNEIDILLSPTIDHTVAYTKLNAIVQKAYAKEQEIIRKSEAALQRTSTLNLQISVPQTYFKFTTTGVAFSIRYAVERDQAQRVHLQMMTELLTAMRQDPELRAMHITSPVPVPQA